MVDRYYRKIEDVESDIENAMQISSILLKLKEYDDDLGKMDTNENDISSNLTKINDNENSISNNLEKIDNISEFILKSDKDLKKYIILNLKYLNLIKIIIFLVFLKKRLNMILLKTVYYL